jgi:hypothetical protein
MKRILILISILVLAFTINVDAQIQNKPFLNDTIKADTNTYFSNHLYDKYSGVVMFTFTHTDVADSLAVAVMQGSNTNTSVISTWSTLTGTAILPLTSTDGTTTLIKTPPEFLYFRVFLSCATGDTVAITNPVFVYKEE